MSSNSKNDEKKRKKQEERHINKPNGKGWFLQKGMKKRKKQNKAASMKKDKDGPTKKGKKEKRVLNEHMVEMEEELTLLKQAVLSKDKQIRDLKKKVDDLTAMMIVQKCTKNKHLEREI